MMVAPLVSVPRPTPMGPSPALRHAGSSRRDIFAALNRHACLNYLSLGLGSFTQPSGARVIRAAFVLHDRRFLGMQVGVGVVHSSTIAMGRMRPGSTALKAFPFVGSWANPDMVRTLASSGRGTKPTLSAVADATPEYEMKSDDEVLSYETQKRIVEELDRLFDNLTENFGFSTDQVLAVAQCHVAVKIAQIYGGPSAGRFLEGVAARAQSIQKSPTFEAAPPKFAGMLQ